MTRSDVYQEVTDRILAALRAGVTPWKKPWTGGGPVSIKGRPYRGINTFLLGLMPYGDPRWGTFKAMKEAGGSVRKGEKATHVILWKPVKRHDEEESSYMLLKTYPVFNAEQCDDLPELEREHVPLEAAEHILNGFVGPTLSSGQMAAYSETLDLVVMPKAETFLSSEGYYSTFFHELVHSTGHKDRLDRLESGGYGTGPYAKEELVAEMGAAMLCGFAGIENLDQSASYIDGWLAALTRDPKLVVQAAAQAQRGADLILGTTFEDSPDSENRKEALVS
jgi:antirestriction protein ArdC